MLLHHKAPQSVYFWLRLIFADAAFLCVGYVVTIFETLWTHLGWVILCIFVTACITSAHSLLSFPFVRIFSLFCPQHFYIWKWRDCRGFWTAVVLDWILRKLSLFFLSTPCILTVFILLFCLFHTHSLSLSLSTLCTQYFNKMTFLQHFVVQGKIPCLWF